MSFILDIKISMKKYIYITLFVLFVAWVIYLVQAPPKPGKLDGFAQCVKDSGAIFYGAFWCPHCQSQKAMFGRSARLLPYVECSTPDSRGQFPVCKDAGVVSYPTWDFLVSGSTTTERVSTTVELEQIAEKTNCVLPE